MGNIALAFTASRGYLRSMIFTYYLENVPMQISKAIWQPFLMTLRLYRLTFAQFIFVPRDFGGSKGHKQGQKVFLLGLVVIINADLNTKYFFTSDNLCLRDGWKDMKQFLIFVGPRFGKFHSIRRKNSSDTVASWPLEPQWIAWGHPCLYMFYSYIYLKVHCSFEWPQSWPRGCMRSWLRLQ